MNSGSKSPNPTTRGFIEISSLVVEVSTLGWKERIPMIYAKHFIFNCKKTHFQEIPFFGPFPHFLAHHIEKSERNDPILGILQWFVLRSDSWSVRHTWKLLDIQASSRRRLSVSYGPMGTTCDSRCWWCNISPFAGHGLTIFNPQFR